MRKLVNALDNILIESYIESAQILSFENDVKVIMDLVEAWERSGDKWNTGIETLMGFDLPKESSSEYTYSFLIKRKILPFLRRYLLKKDPPSRLTDIIAFGQPNFLRIKEEMVQDCNITVGSTVGVKKNVLVAWTRFLRSLQWAAKDRINTLGYRGMKDIREWYDELLGEVSLGVSRLNKFYARARTDKNFTRRKKEAIPMNEAIQKWLDSDIRNNLRTELLECAMKIKREGGRALVTGGDYTRFREFVLTELSVYFPVRIGAWCHFTTRAFLKSQPAWSVRDEGDSDQTRTVTRPPANACVHQKSAKEGSVEMLGLTGGGEKCCEQSVTPTCFLAQNYKDKGGKTNSEIAISMDGHRLMSAFLTVRTLFFGKSKESDALHGDEPFFPNSKGNLSERKPSDFRLMAFNRAVYGEQSDIVVTPQDLRKWNTTFLAMHPDPKVSGARGPATGNTEPVFRDHYDLTRRARVMDSLMACWNHHNKEEIEASFSQDFEEARIKLKEAIEEANEAVLYRPDGVDLTSRGKPVHCHLRNLFRRDLELVEPGLWDKVGHKTKELAMSEMKWVWEIVNVLGREECEDLRNIIIEQYRGLPNVEDRLWSGLRTHMEVMNKVGEYDGKTPHNCPLVATLRMFFSSARARNKKQRSGDKSQEDIDREKQSSDEQSLEMDSSDSFSDS